MSAGAISKELEEFIWSHIDSVELMEVLFLLCRHSDRAWSAEEVAARLQIQSDSAGRRLATLLGAGFCVAGTDGAARIRYQPADSSRDRLVRELMDAYKTRHVAVITLIFSRPPEQLRLFSDAFKLRKDT